MALAISSSSAFPANGSVSGAQGMRTWTMVGSTSTFDTDRSTSGCSASISAAVPGTSSGVMTLNPPEILPWSSLSL